MTTFSVTEYDYYHRYFINTSELDAQGLLKAYVGCNNPYREMEKFGSEIGFEKYISICQQQEEDRNQFDVEFRKWGDMRMAEATVEMGGHAIDGKLISLLGNNEAANFLNI